MTGEYVLQYEGKNVGWVRVGEAGLYWHLSCRCKTGKMEKLDLILQAGDERVNFGLLIPREDGFGLDVRLAKKRVPAGRWQFCLHSRKEEGKEMFFPVEQGKPFPGIRYLHRGRYIRRDGLAGIIVSCENNVEKLENGT